MQGDGWRRWAAGDGGRGREAAEEVGAGCCIRKVRTKFAVVASLQGRFVEPCNMLREVQGLRGGVQAAADEDGQLGQCGGRSAEVRCIDSVRV